MPDFRFDVDDCSLIVAVLVHYAGHRDRSDPDAVRAHDLVLAITCSVGQPPAALVRQRPQTRS